MNQPVKVDIVPFEHVDAVWSCIAKQMQHACERSEQEESLKINAGDLWQMCRSGNGFLIIAHDNDPMQPLMASVWRFEDTPTVFKCMMLYGPGMKRWFGPLTKFVSTIAKDNGAVALVSKGRRGWQRYFEPSANYDIELKLGA